MGSFGRRRFLAGACALLAATHARAQDARKKVRIGALTQVDTFRSPVWKLFFAELEKRGWLEGREYSFVVKEGRGDPARYLDLSRELVREGVDLVLAVTTAPALAFRQVSDKIPVVAWCGYPVEAGLVASLSRPGGNVTGVASYAGTGVWSKMLELLRELKPGLAEVGVLWDYLPPGFPEGPIGLEELDEGAGRLRMRHRVWSVRKGEEVAAALAQIEASPLQALMVSAGGGATIDPVALSLIGETLTRRRLPSITDLAGTVFAKAGCTLAYSPSIVEIHQRLAAFVDRILRGAKPAELPFERPTRFDLVVNAKSARAIGLSVPQSLLLRADRVIE